MIKTLGKLIGAYLEEKYGVKYETTDLRANEHPLGVTKTAFHTVKGMKTREIWRMEERVLCSVIEVSCAITPGDGENMTKFKNFVENKVTSLLYEKNLLARPTQNDDLIEHKNPDVVEIATAILPPAQKLPPPSAPISPNSGGLSSRSFVGSTIVGKTADTYVKVAANKVKGAANKVKGATNNAAKSVNQIARSVRNYSNDVLKRRFDRIIKLIVEYATSGTINFTVRLQIDADLKPIGFGIWFNGIIQRKNASTDPELLNLFERLNSVEVFNYINCKIRNTKKMRRSLEDIESPKMWAICQAKSCSAKSVAEGAHAVTDVVEGVSGEVSRDLLLIDKITCPLDLELYGLISDFIWYHIPSPFKKKVPLD